MKLNDNITSEVKEYFDIVQFAGRYLKLKKAGASYKALCPFHNEKSPSFTINQIRQNFHCFGCGESGDVISFYMKIENLPFIDALKNLCKEAGLQIPSKTEKDPLFEKKSLLYKVHEIAMLFYQNQLKSSPKAMDYLLERGLQAHTIDSFQLGFANTSWDALLNHLRSKHYNDDALKESGLFVFSEKTKSYFDRFKNRIMFPITDLSGNIIGFSGRLLPSQSVHPSDNKEPKYLNSPETLIFKKSHVVFGMAQAKTAIRKTDLILLAEGHLDVCLLHQHEYYNAVGTQGTAFTEHHARILSKLSKNWELIFDGDLAGTKAALSIWPFSTQYNINCHVTSLPQNEDPASILSTGKKEIFNQILKNHTPILNYKLNHLLTEHKKDSPQFVEELQIILNTIKSIANPVAQDIKLEIIAQQLQISVSAIKNLFNQHAKIFPVSFQKIESGQPLKAPKAELSLLGLLIHYPDKFEAISHSIELEWLSDFHVKSEIENICHQISTKAWDFAQYLDSIHDNSFKQKLNELKEGLCNNFDLNLKDTAKSLEENYLIRKIDTLQNQLNTLNSTNPTEFKEVATHIQELKNRCRDLNTVSSKSS